MPTPFTSSWAFGVSRGSLWSICTFKPCLSSSCHSISMLTFLEIPSFGGPSHCVLIHWRAFIGNTHVVAIQLQLVWATWPMLLLIKISCFAIVALNVTDCRWVDILLLHHIMIGVLKVFELNYAWFFCRSSFGDKSGGWLCWKSVQRLVVVSWKDEGWVVVDVFRNSRKSPAPAIHDVMHCSPLFLVSTTNHFTCIFATYHRYYLYSMNSPMSL